MENLNEEQLKAVKYKGNKKNLLVVAGAGTGKTKTMVNRVKFLISEKNISPERILCLTFTNKAAKELVSRIETDMPNNLDNLLACTFHSFCIKLIKKIPKSFGYTQLPTIIDQQSQLTLMSSSLVSIMEQYEIDENKKAIIPKPKVLLSEYSYARNAMISFIEQFKKNVTDEVDIVEICHKTIQKYEEEKNRMDYVDFDDILERVVNVAEEKPLLAKEISNLFYEVLVDEMQDTNPIQYRILKLLSSGSSRIFATGDPAQSIYGFRGADFDSLYNFTNIFPNSEKINLFMNYRSSQEILDVANKLMCSSKFNYNNQLKSIIGYSGEKNYLNDFENKEDEAIFISKNILKLREEDGYDFSDFFIIIRSSFSGTAIESVLKKYNIPYKFIGGLSINKTSHVQDLLSILKFANNQKDMLSCIRFLKMFPKIGDKTALKGYNKLSNIDKDRIPKELSLIVKKDKDRIYSIYSSVINAINNKNNPIKDIMKNGFKELIKENYLQNSDYRIKDIETIGGIYNQYKGDIESFINDFTLEPVMNKVESAEDESEDKVTLITAHSAKGLENKVCYIAGAVPGVFPSKRSIGSVKKEEEERRVMYVALTRAKEKLIVTRPLEYNNQFFKNAKTKINFIEDIKNLFEKNKKTRLTNSLGGISKLNDSF